MKMDDEAAEGDLHGRAMPVLDQDDVDALARAAAVRVAPAGPHEAAGVEGVRALERVAARAQHEAGERVRVDGDGAPRRLGLRMAIGGVVVRTLHAGRCGCVS